MTLRPKSIKLPVFVEHHTMKNSYELEQFQDAFERYLSGTTEQPSQNNELR